MVPSTSPRRRAAALVVAFVAALFGSSAPAQNLDKLDTSLKLIPADTAFYSTMLRNKEQIDAIAKSKAWNKLWNLPAVQKGWTELQREYDKKDGQLAPLRNFLDDKENQDLVALLADAASNEIFVCGGESWVGFLTLAQHVYSGFSYGPLKAQLAGNPGGKSQEELQVQALLRALAKDTELIKAPDLVIGFKVSDAQRVENQLKRLEAIITLVALQVPEAKGRIQRVKINDGNFLTVRLDGALVPWDKIPWKNFEDKADEFAPLVKKLKGLTLTISVGVQHGYLMLGIGSTTDHLARLGGAGARLSTIPEFKPLGKYADRKLTSIGYTSQSFASLSFNTYDYDELLNLAKEALPKSPIPEEHQKRIIKDLTQLSRELKAAVPQPGAHLMFSFMTERGFESFSYDYGKHPEVDASKPLTLLNHVGGMPILAVVGRGKVDGQGYAMLSKWVKIGWDHVDEIAKANLNGDEKAEYVKFVNAFLPLARRFDDVTAKDFIPALADGQGAFVVDAKWSSKSWIATLPTEKAMPMLELGIVLGVSDAKKLEKAMGDYRTLVNDMIGAVRALQGAAGQIGDFKIPAPEMKKGTNGTLYYYPIPPILGLDQRVVPTAALSDKVATLTLSHEHAERLLKSTPLKIDGGPLSDPSRPLAGAVVFDFPALIQAATPWVELAANTVIDQQLGADTPQAKREEILKQVRTVLEVMTVLRGATSVTYLEGGVLVTHTETVVRDLDK